MQINAVFTLGLCFIALVNSSGEIWYLPKFASYRTLQDTISSFRYYKNEQTVIAMTNQSSWKRISELNITLKTPESYLRRILLHRWHLLWWLPLQRQRYKRAFQTYDTWLTSVVSCKCILRNHVHLLCDLPSFFNLQGRFVHFGQSNVRPIPRLRYKHQSMPIHHKLSWTYVGTHLRIMHQLESRE